MLKRCICGDRALGLARFKQAKSPSFICFSFLAAICVLCKTRTLREGKSYLPGKGMKVVTDNSEVIELVEREGLEPSTPAL
jgi:hypothetical protein